MELFKRTKTERPLAAVFTNVTPGQRRTPSWVVTQNRRSAANPGIAKPGRMPADLLAQEDHHMAAEPAHEAGPSSARGDGAVLLAQRLAAEELERLRLSSEHELRRMQAEYEARVAQVQGELSAALTALTHERERIAEQSLRQLCELSIAVARRVIAREVRTDRSIVLRLVQDGLSALGEHERVTVYVGRGFADMQNEVESQLQASGASSKVVVDARLPEFGCRVETEFGKVDESIENRLELLLGALLPE